jgi:hypothetical protein
VHSFMKPPARLRHPKILKKPSTVPSRWLPLIPRCWARADRKIFGLFVCLPIDRADRRPV